MAKHKRNIVGANEKSYEKWKNHSLNLTLPQSDNKNFMNKKTCIHEHLAATELGQVLVCRKCTKVHLLLQNLSLQFSVESFIDITNSLNEASEKIMPTAKQKTTRPALNIVK